MLVAVIAVADSSECRERPVDSVQILYPDPGLVIMIAPCGLLGVLLGVRILELVSIEVLQHGMAGALLVVGTLTLWQASTRDYSEDTENAPPPPVVV